MDSHTGVNGIKQEGLLGGLLDVSVNEQRVCLGVNILHHDLETVEASSLGDLNLATETLDKVLVHDTIRGSKESQDVGDEVSFIVVESVVPVVHVLRQIDLFGSPKGGFGFLVHLPDLY